MKKIKIRASSRGGKLLHSRRKNAEKRDERGKRGNRLRSPGVVGDVPLALLASNGTLLSNGSLTYYAPGEPPTIVSFSPAGGACSASSAELTVVARNVAPTASLRCGFGELGNSAAAFVGASRASLAASEGEVRCTPPPSALLGGTLLISAARAQSNWWSVGEVKRTSNVIVAQRRRLKLPPKDKNKRTFAF